jgi:hypothetical protein
MLNTTKYLIATLLFALVAPAAASARPMIDTGAVVHSTPPDHEASLVLPLAGAALVLALICVTVLVRRSARRHAVKA